MKYALISHYSAELNTLLKQGHSAYHMMLGQHFVSSTNGYRLLYEALHAYGHFIMVDNGAHEGEQGDFHELVNAVQHIADEIVLPDVLYDDRATMMACSHPHVLRIVPIYQRCIVPQGVTVEQWCNCLDWLVENVNFRTIGIPKHLNRNEDGRKRALMHILTKGYHRSHALHLFGIWGEGSIREELRGLRRIATEGNARIRGIDSACAVSYAQNGALLTHPLRFSMRWGAPFDLALAQENMRLMRLWCNESDDNGSDNPTADIDENGIVHAGGTPATIRE